jgi:hypothetical protein
MKTTMYDILREISEIESQQRRVAALQQHIYTQAIKQVCIYTFDPNVKWLLPEGKPPYKPCEFVDVEGRFISELRKLYLFVEGGNPNLTTLRRESLFIQLIESIDPKDAALLCSMKDKKLPFKGITKKVIQQAFPDINC